MGTVRVAPLPLICSDGREVGTLFLRLLPRTDADQIPAPLLDVRDDPGRDTDLEPIQVLESMEYLYEVDLPGQDKPQVTIQPTDLFDPETDTGLRGRLRPGLHTGSLPVTVNIADSEVCRTAIEVRTTKLDYVSDYRRMLADVADQFAEIIMERFAPTEQSFDLDQSRDAATIYQRFAFLKALIAGDNFRTAIQHVLSRPHRAWVDEEESRLVGKRIPASSRALRQLSRPGPRVPWKGGPIEALPHRMTVYRTEETVDTPENRFVQFALGRWRDVIAHFGRLLDQEQESAPVLRGRTEVADVLRYLDELLSADLFREVGPLHHFPAASPVLQKRMGYREILRAYTQFETAAALTWEGGDDVYSAGQKNVAALYEFWVFLQLAEVISSLCREPLDRRSLIVERPEGLGIGLKRGQRRVLAGSVSRLGRKLRLELWYNRSFAVGEGPGSSWTRRMDPDYSLLIEPAKGSPGFEPVWVHFDAKYRVENLEALFGADVGEVSGEGKVDAKRDDLLKMHAYRDAIRRSAGAYVIYPGTKIERAQRYHEILPGLGAFSLRPGETGAGIGALHRFIDDVLTHVASQVTQHERARYWEEHVYSPKRQIAATAEAAPFLIRPPADTQVLLGYVKSDEHLEWIHEQRRYNLRADDRTGSVGLGARELGVDLVLLYGPGLENVEIWPVIGEPQIMTREGMVGLGYPEPRSQLYQCLRLGDPVPEAWFPEISMEEIEQVRLTRKPGAMVGAPIAVTWLDLMV